MGKAVKEGEMMHDFKYKGKELYCEGVAVKDIVKKVGTPVYIYSHKTFVEHIKKIQDAFKSVKPLICYSMKANSNIAILKSVIKQCAGLYIVSGGELFRAKKVGCKPKNIVFAGVGKTRTEIEDAIKYGILLFNVESLPELELINQVARKLKKKARVSLRINPNVDPRTHDYIATGKKESKFGIDLEAAEAIFKANAKYRNVSMCAIHVHIGSQIVTGEPFVEAFKKVLKFIDEIKKFNVKIDYLNLGGGLGVIYSNETPQTAAQFAKKILPLFKGRKIQLVFEPGRFVAANGGILAAEVQYIKRTKVKNFAITDAGMNDLIRPTLYEAYHEIWPITKKKNSEKEIYDVVGPICESGDFFAKDRYLPKLASDDLIAVMSSGAYGFVMSSNYNSKPRACEILVKGSKFAVVRKREQFQNLIAGESIPALI